MKLSALFLLIMTLLFCSCEPVKEELPPVKYVGTRSSYYGFKNFPEPDLIGRVVQNMALDIPGSEPAVVWIVGGIRGGGVCALEFPAPDDETYDYIDFQYRDKHEPYLTHFDTTGVKVFLQIEAGLADMEDLIRLVLDQYSHHPSVAGFGIDVEWYPSDGTTNGVDGGINKTLDDHELRRFDSLVKSYNPEYRVFVKHWLPEYCGTNPVSDVIYINDSQMFESITPFLDEFQVWADYFSPNESGFQVGYLSDTLWWEQLGNPLVDLNDSLAGRLGDDNFHLFWVDFTIERESMEKYWDLDFSGE